MKIKNLYVRVKDGTIKVSANTYTSDRYIKDLLERERPNIEKMLETISIPVVKMLRKYLVEY